MKRIQTEINRNLVIPIPAIVYDIYNKELSIHFLIFNFTIHFRKN